MSAIVAKTQDGLSPAILKGLIRMPPIGVWTADITIDQPDGTGFDEGTSVTIACDGGLSFVGTVAPRTGDFLDVRHLRLMGGANGMGNAAKPSGFMQPGALCKDVINSLTKASGESLSSKTDQSFLNTNLMAWMITDRSCAANLDVLLGIVAPSSVWRILADGTLWIGAESWPTSNDSYVLSKRDPIDAHYELAVDVPTIVPGVNLGNANAIGFSDAIGNVAMVEHHIEGDSVTTWVWNDLIAQRGEAAAIIDLAQHATANFDFSAMYDVTVKSQSADLTTVDVNPPASLTKIDGLQRVPLLQPFPQCKVQVPNGVNVRLGWYRGNPQFPFAALFLSGDSVTRIQLGGNTDAARKGDHSGAGTWLFAFVGGTGGATLSVTYTDPDGSVTVLGSGSGTVNAKAKLTEGSSVVGLG